MECSMPGSSVHGILQARILEEVAIPFIPGIEPGSPALHADSLKSEPPGKPLLEAKCVPSHTGASLSHEKERSPDTRYHVDGP